MLGERRYRILATVLVGAAMLSSSAAVALSRIVSAGEYEKADVRLAAELAGAVRAVRALDRGARARAVGLAARLDVQRALGRRDTERLTELVVRIRGVAFQVRGRRIAAGRAAPIGVAAAVVVNGEEVGRVLVEVPLAAVAARTALAEGDRLAAGRAGPLEPRPTTLRIDGRSYRALSTQGGSARLTALAPVAPIDAAIAERRRRMLLAAFGSFAAVALLAALLARAAGPSPPQLRRTGDEPPLARGGRRTRHAATLVGNALAAGHDVDALLPVILDSAVAVTGASGGRLVADGEELARAGAIGGAGRPLSLSLAGGPATGGQLVLYPAAEQSFDDESVRLAEWLAGRASIALQNAHLHRLARRQASTDELTQLANRRQFDEALGAEIVRAERFHDPVAVVVADLDNFKHVNDRFGHDIGDIVLRAFAAVIQSNVRDVDLPARYGGEEFTILLPATDAEGGRELAERLRVALEELAVDVGTDVSVKVTSSFGVAGYPQEPSAAALMRAADRALYRAKGAGKNTVVTAERAASVQ